jgi:hypothetical protein
LTFPPHVFSTAFSLKIAIRKHPPVLSWLRENTTAA